MKSKPRNKFLRCRVDDTELERVATHARKRGRTTSDHLRQVVSEDLELNGLEGLERQKVGAPVGNANKKGKRGGNQFTKKRGK